MKTIIPILTLVSSLTLAHAQSYVSSLDPAQDGGGARTGIGNVSYTLTGNSMAVSGNFSGLSGNSIAAHIHGPSAPFPSTGSVRYDFGALGLITLGGTSGTVSGSFNLGDIGAYTVAQQKADLDAGLWYLNIHSTTFGGGEIRGVLQLVPEPSSLCLFGLGAGGLFYRLRRKQ